MLGISPKRNYQTYRSVSGSSNNWPENTTRWMRSFRKRQVIRRTASATPLTVVTQTLDNSDFRRADTTATRVVEDKHKGEASRDIIEALPKLLIVDGAALSSDKAVDLKLRLFTIVHFCAAGHRGAGSACHALHKELAWSINAMMFVIWSSSAFFVYYQRAAI